MPTPPALNKGELEIARTHLTKPAIDPFGLIPASASSRRWDVAKAIDSMFTRRTVSKGHQSFEDMFYCRDCDCFVRCSNLSHSIYVRCMGSGCEHCVEC